MRQDRPARARPRRRDNTPRAKSILHRTILAAAALAVASAAPARAQVQQNNPNAADRALANEAQTRTLQENQTSQSDMMQMNIERNQMSAPPPPGGTVVGRPTGPGIP